MKIISLLLLVLLTETVSAQQYTFDGQHLVFEQVIQVDSLSAKEIYRRVEAWTIESFANSEQVVTGKLEGSMIAGDFTTKYTFPMVSSPMAVWHHLQIKVKDGALKLTIDQLVIKQGGYTTPIEASVLKKDHTVRPMYQNTLQEMNQAALDILKSLERSMAGTKDDW